MEANSLAIQVHGGYGNTRDFPVEQYWRDNRLNMIHEGTHGIQGLDLLGRKVRQDEGAAMRLLRARVDATIQAAAEAERRWSAIKDVVEDVDSLPALATRVRVVQDELSFQLNVMQALPFNWGSRSKS